jgi:hypothetical protein
MTSTLKAKVQEMRWGEAIDAIRVLLELPVGHPKLRTKRTLLKAIEDQCNAKRHHEDGSVHWPTADGQMEVKPVDVNFLNSNWTTFKKRLYREKVYPIHEEGIGWHNGTKEDVAGKQTHKVSVNAGIAENYNEVSDILREQGLQTGHMHPPVVELLPPPRKK